MEDVEFKNPPVPIVIPLIRELDSDVFVVGDIKCENDDLADSVNMKEAGWGQTTVMGKLNVEETPVSCFLNSDHLIEVKTEEFELLPICSISPEESPYREDPLSIPEGANRTAEREEQDGRSPRATASEYSHIQNGMSTEECDTYGNCLLHLPTKLYKCTVCGRNFLKELDLVEHNHTHTGEKPYECPVCAKRFTKQNYILNHFCRHKKYRKVGESSLVSDALKSYTCQIRLERPKIPSRYLCEVCGKGFAKKYDLKDHVQEHKFYYCEKCNTSFKTGFRLFSHIKRWHQLVKRFLCDICGEDFDSQGSLSEHMGGHKEQGESKCNICGKLVGSNSSLLLHNLLHNGHQSLKCYVCFKRFTSRSDLANHTFLNHKDTVDSDSD